MEPISELTLIDAADVRPITSSIRFVIHPVLVNAVRRAHSETKPACCAISLGVNRPEPPFYLPAGART